MAKKKIERKERVFVRHREEEKENLQSQKVFHWNQEGAQPPEKAWRSNENRRKDLWL